jgi:hypothetical protein
MSVIFLKLLISILIQIFYSSAPPPTPSSFHSNAKLVWLFICVCFLILIFCRCGQNLKCTLELATAVQRDSEMQVHYFFEFYHV